MKQKQYLIFYSLLAVYALCAFLTYALFADQLASAAGIPMPELPAADWVVGLANAGIVIVLYGLLGLAGNWFAARLDLPGIFRADGNWRGWFAIPLVLGVLCGLLLILGDWLFAPFNELGPFPHPPFPASILASISAGIGEEIMFRAFVFGLWAWILTWAFKRFNGRQAALWIANLIAALAFGAGHLGSVMVLAGASNPADLPAGLLAEIFVLNGIIGLVAGERYIKEGLVAAVGVHFWTDVIWHIIWGLVSV